MSVQGLKAGALTRKHHFLGSQGCALLKMGYYFTGSNKTPWGVAVVSMVTLNVKQGV